MLIIVTSLDSSLPVSLNIFVYFCIISKVVHYVMGYTVPKLVEALRYKPGGREFDFR